MRSLGAMDPLSPAEQRPAGPSVWAEVKDVVLQGTEKRLRVSGTSAVTVHAFACVGKGDMVRCDASGDVWVRAGDASLHVTPGFRLELRQDIAPGLTLTVLGGELVHPDEFAAYHALSQFHYRTEKSFGRRAVLLLQTSDPGFPKYVGFIEVTTPFLQMRNRSRIFDAPFAEPGESMSWTKWDLETRNRFTNVVARVSRVVVHPELRGLGLSRPLLEAAAVYARQRWQVRGLRPLFLEITADMLRFMPFVSGAGLRFIGESEGNLSRLAKDMVYLSRAQEGGGGGSHSVLSGRGKGILRRQKRDIAHVTRLRDEMAPGESIGEFLGQLLSSEDVDAQASELLLPLLRHPKASYMRGLTRRAEAFLTRRTAELHVAQSPASCPPVAPYSGSVDIDDLSLMYAIDTGELTANGGGAVRRAFGLERSFAFRTGISNLSVEVRPGEICYLFGASGSGKTTLLSLLMNPPAQDSPLAVRGSVRLPNGVRIGEMAPPSTGVPLMSAIGAEDLEQAIYALNSAGLAEPRLYLSRFEQLSAGQQYRASLAKLICSGSNVWLLDEFAAGLDDATGVAVGRNFAKAARHLGVILIVATVRRQPLVNAMSPDVVVHLTQLEPPLVSRDWKQWAGVDA